MKGIPREKKLTRLFRRGGFANVLLRSYSFFLLRFPRHVSFFSPQILFSWFLWIVLDGVTRAGLQFCSFFSVRLYQYLFEGGFFSFFSFGWGRVGYIEEWRLSVFAGSWRAFQKEEEGEVRVMMNYEESGKNEAWILKMKKILKSESQC